MTQSNWLLIFPILPSIWHSLLCLPATWHRCSAIPGDSLFRMDLSGLNPTIVSFVIHTMKYAFYLILHYPTWRNHQFDTSKYFLHSNDYLAGNICLLLYTETLKSLNASLRLVFKLVLRLRLPIIKAQLTW